ncbi:hypothetical protein LY76DRAFT_686617 [Colletotrichum caudatum]|nr:hypothetical protein LY76DRAFT_686617 [Colletotrichum caudatum]
MASSTSTKYIASTFPENPLLTADFSPPAASCAGIYYTNKVYAIDNDKKCLPGNFNGASTAFYSPGTACPTGYTAQTQCSRNDGVRSITTVTCCPYRGDMTLSCVDEDMTLGGVLETQFCTWTADTATIISFTRTDDGIVATQAVMMNGRNGVNAWGIRMVYQASDLVPKTTSATATTTTSETTATETGAGITATATVTATGGGGGGGIGGGGLGTGAIIGIAALVPLVLTAALVGLFFWWKYRAGVKPVDATPTAPEMDGQSPYQHQHQHQLQYPPPVQEMAGTSVGEYYKSTEKVLTNPGARGGHTQIRGWAHPAHVVAELGTGEEPTELPADNGRR